MLLRVYVQPREEFDRWLRRTATAGAHQRASVARGRQIFETTACINCHTVSGTVANGRFGPDLTHLMSRDTLASGAVAEHARESSAVDQGSRQPSSRDR